ncbi:MAG: energy transducer TonB [Acidobacteria bacterium]|nr:MAG: energy transducer TonB [Acidobacteriota bacterium]
MGRAKPYRSYSISPERSSRRAGLEPSSRCGVYPGMFEQSMLLDAATGRKTGALAASVTAQTLAIGVLVFMPLMYIDRLPELRPWMSLPLQNSPPRHTPDPVKPRTNPQPGRLALAASHVFLFSMRQHDAAPGPTVLPETGAPMIASQEGVPSGLGSALPRVIDAPPPPANPPATVKAPDKPHPVGGDVQAAKLIRRVIPPYPPLARQARVSGTVRLIGVIAKDGTIRQLQVVSGHPLLVGAAVDAVRQWVYRPTLLNGEPVEVIAPIDVIFTFSL